MTRVNSSVARLVAERLMSAEDRALAELFRHRRYSPHAAPASSWNDFFDVAETLLRPDAVAAALSSLPREELAALAAGEPRDTLTLTDADGRPLPGVAEALGDVSPLPASIPTPADPADAGHAAERAFTTLTALADLILIALRSPLARVATGSLGVAERRRLAERDVVGSADEADVLARLATVTGLMRGHGRHLFATSAGAEWVEQSTPRRWADLAERLRDALPAGLRTSEDGWIDPAQWDQAYPLDDAWPRKARGWLAFARLAGLVAGADPAEPTWARPLREGRRAEPEALVALLPQEVDRVYLQNDLTAISPGTLAPTIDARLRQMAVRESQAQASSYRFTEATIARALSAGETADSMRAFLAEVSLTGMPQPLDYLIQRSAERHGLVRVSRELGSDRTIVSSPDHDLLRTVAVDQSLAPLGLVPEGALLLSRAGRDATFWALADARYPVVVLEADGSVAAPDRHRLAPESGEQDDFLPLIARLREHQGADADRAWLRRELEGAIRDRATLAIVVNMPDGSARELTLEPTGIGGGRLRGRDARADVERTLPISLIQSAKRA